MLTIVRTLMLITFLFQSVVYFTTSAAPSICHNCDVGCNDTFTNSNPIDSEMSPLNRTKRESTVEQRRCSKFEIEMVLIPSSVALIPFGLCALLLCICYCGPKESRGKVPEIFKKRCQVDAKDAHEIDNVEPTCKDKVATTSNSKKTRFSTSVSYIEALHISADNMTSNDKSIICPLSHAEHQPSDLKSKLKREHNAVDEHGNEEEGILKDDHVTRRTSTKHARFLDGVDVLGISIVPEIS